MAAIIDLAFSSVNALTRQNDSPRGMNQINLYKGALP